MWCNNNHLCRTININILGLQMVVSGNANGWKFVWISDSTWHVSIDKSNNDFTVHSVVRLWNLSTIRYDVSIQSTIFMRFKLLMNIKIKILLHFFQFLDKFRLCRTDLQRIVTGGILAGMAFIVSGVLELKLSVSFTNL